MTDSAKHHVVAAARRRRAPALAVATAALALAATLATVAFAASTLTIGSAANSKLGEQVVVNAQGHTIYALSPETASHLLCKSAACVKAWPPLTVHSRTTKLKDGPGVKGHLGILHRSNGMLQVTLAGHPLYRYSGDSGKDESNGQGLESFGGTWHAVTASSVPGSTAPSTAPATPPMAPSTPPYNY